jgi:hypothetical protein
MNTNRRTVFLAGMIIVTPLVGQSQSAPQGQTQEDEYTRYELLAPDTQQFAIVYDVTATAPGATFYFNPIRKGSVASDERVIDLLDGRALTFEVVSGAEAKRSGMVDADADTDYIKVHLPRPVPKDGEVRLRIFKTYKDPKTYRRDGDAIVFDRSLGIRRNSVVLPRGYELIGCNVPSQVLTDEDGRIRISFMNPTAAPAPLVVRARPLPAVKPTSAPREVGTAGDAPQVAISRPASSRDSGSAASADAGLQARLSERAFQDREIVYFLQQPETHAFSLYHDYTEWRPGTDKYLNVVRAGSTVSNPSARVLDTGETLKTETLTGDQITAAKIDIEEPVRPETEVVVIRFPAVQKGHSIRLRVSETYTDPARFRVEGQTLVWDRSFSRPRNTIVLPEGWYLADSAIPAVVTQMPDGRIRLYFENDRPDEISTLVRARKRT